MRSICVAERGLRGRGEALLLARPESPSRCTLPITALRVIPPSSAAIWLAERPSDHSFFNSSTRSSVHDMPNPPQSCARGLLTESPNEPGSAQPPNTQRLTNAVEDCPRKRDVVLDDQKATIWRESGARVPRRASTYSPIGC